MNNYDNILSYIKVIGTGIFLEQLQDHILAFSVKGLNTAA